MFETYLEGFADVINEAKSSKHITQSHLLQVYKVIEEYVKSNRLILSNAEAFLEDEVFNRREYVIYGTNIFNHANNLANKISKVNIYVKLYTNLKNEDFSILVNGGNLVSMFNIKKGLMRIINPINHKGVLMYPPEFELINIYHKLYSPIYHKEWEKIEKIERGLVKTLYHREPIIGGHINENRNMYNSLVIEWLKKRGDYILIGFNAVNILTKKEPNHGKIQIIASSVDNIITGLGKMILKHTGYHMSHKVFNARINTEPRLQKTLVDITIHETKPRTIRILEIYNSAEYELVPYVVYDNINVGYPDVLRMLLLVDMFFIRVLSSINTKNKKMAQTEIHNIFNYIKLSHSIDLSPLVESYIGINSSLIKYKKKQGLKNEFFPYIPEQYRYHNGSYRLLD
jgi:hypothetical protein